LIARHRELSMLDECLESACSGQAAVAVIRGEAGIGKTRLAETMIDRARRSDVRVVVGHCTPVSGGELPFGPFVQMLTQVAAAPGGLEETTGGTWDELKSVLTVSGRPSDVAAPDVGLERSRLFTSVLWALQHLGESQPVMAVIEDIHWADSSSLDLLNYLARTAAQKRLLVLLTCRDEALSGSPATRKAVVDLSRAGMSRQIQLHPLSPDQVRELLAASDVSLQPAEYERVVDLSDGNPFLALELATHDGIDGAEPLRELLLGPIDELPDDARSALHVAAVLGQYIPHSVLEHAVEDTTGNVAATLRLLTERGFLVHGSERYHFRHAILRESVVRSMLHGEQTAAHRAAVRGIRLARLDEVPAGLAQLAHHLVGAEDHPAALVAVMSASDYAQRVFAFAEARRHLSVAREVLWSRVDRPEELIGLTYQDLLCREAEMARWAGQPSAAAALLREGIPATAAQGVDRARLEHELGETLWAAGDPAASLAAYRRGVTALGAGPDDPGLRVRLLEALARGQIVTGQYDEARVSAQRAITVAEQAGTPRDALQARVTLATTTARLGELETGTAQLRQCLAEALAINAFQAVVRCFGNLAFLNSTAGRLGAVLEIGAEAARTCRPFGPLLLVAPTLAENWVHALVATGRWDEADELAQRLEQEWTAEGMALALHLQLALIPAARGDDVGFQREMAIIEDVARRDDPYGLHGVTSARAEHLLWQGQPAEALRITRDTLDVLADQQDTGLVISMCSLALRAHADLVAARADRVLGEQTRDETARLLAIAEDAARGDGQTLDVAYLAVCEGEAARASMRPAVDEWSAAVAAWEQLECPYPAAYARWRQAEELFGAQARAQGTRAMASALQAATSLRCRPLEQSLRTLARHAGVSTDSLVDEQPEVAASSVPTSTGLPVPLTPRELDVLRLLTQGCSNQQIARRLFIAESTASVHVSHILAKLGVSNRLQAAAAAHRFGLFPVDDEQV